MLLNFWDQFVSTTLWAEITLISSELNSQVNNCGWDYGQNAKNLQFSGFSVLHLFTEKFLLGFFSSSWLLVCFN